MGFASKVLATKRHKMHKMGFFRFVDDASFYGDVLPHEDMSDGVLR
jgi:hypothetical protein